MGEWMPVFLELLKTDNAKLRAICANTCAEVANHCLIKNLQFLTPIIFYNFSSVNL